MIKRKPGAKKLIKTPDHPIYIAYEKYLNGDTKALDKLEPSHRDILDRATRAMTAGKTAYQAAEETGIQSDVFYLLTAIKKRVKRRDYLYKCRTQDKVFSEDVLAAIQSRKRGKCTAEVLSKKFSCDTDKIKDHLVRLVKAGKVQKIKTDKECYWVACEVTEVIKV